MTTEKPWVTADGVKVGLGDEVWLPICAPGFPKLMRGRVDGEWIASQEDADGAYFYREYAFEALETRTVEYLVRHRHEVLARLERYRNA